MKEQVWAQVGSDGTGWITGTRTGSDWHFFGFQDVVLGVWAWLARDGLDGRGWKG